MIFRLLFFSLICLTACRSISIPSRIDFYSTKDPYGDFSNFAAFPIILDGEIWPTSEHYYQAHKYTDPIRIKWVQSAATPMEAALRGRDPTVEKRKDWIQVKDSIMEKAVRKKFESHKSLQQLLISTNDASLFEHTKNDCYWGDCGDRSGQNKLGKLLEVLRDEYQRELK